MKRRILALIMAQLLVVGSAASSVNAAEIDVSQTESVYEDTEEEVLTGAENTLTAEKISGNNAGNSATEIAAEAEDSTADSSTGSATEIEEALASQEEILVGRPAATEVTECGDEGTFAQALLDINYAYPCEFEGEILLDRESGTVTDENGEELVGADRYVTAALVEEDPEAAAQLLKESGYSNVTVEEGTIRADDRYDTGRIFVTSGEPVDTRGALSVVTFGNTYLLQYASSDEAAIAAEMLRDDPGVTEVLPDFVIKLDGQVTEVETLPEANSEEVGATEMLSETDSEEPETIETQSELVDISEEGKELQAGSDPGTDPEVELEAEDDPSPETPVGRYFVGTYGYLSAAVSYMGIDTFLNNSGTVNNNVTVAVLDSGYDTNCSFVDYNRVLVNRGILLAGSTMRDVANHGTFVLNQIYEATDAAVRLIPVKISDDSEGSYAASVLVAGIYKVVDAGADFANISSGGYIDFFHTFTPGEEALQYALDHQCYVITAAGNESNHINFVWPAKSNRCLTISAISYVTSRPTAYTNYGDAIDFAAPSGDENGLLYGYTSYNKRVGMAGTSFAAPYYTAILANLKANGRSYTTLTGTVKSLARYCEESLTPGASEYSVGNGCVYLPNAINRTIKSGSVAAIADQAYTGSAITPNPVVTYSGEALTKGRDYVVSYKNNYKIGTATVIVTGRGIYKGTVKKEFSIVRRSIAKAAVTTKYKSYTYTGKPRKPAVTVKLDGKTLTQGTDYTIEYIDNVGPGVATIRVRGIGSYRGSATGSFGLTNRVTSVTPGLTYLLVPKLSTGMAVTLKGGGMVNNTELRVNAKTCAESQMFKLKLNSDGSYSFINMKCELAMDCYQGKTDVGKSLVIRDYSTARATEKWGIEACGDGTFVIVNRKSGLAIGAHDHAERYAALKMHTKSGSSAQRFYFEQISAEEVTYPYDGTYTLGASKNADFVIDVPAASKSSGTVLQVYEANGTAAQQFRFIYSGGGTYRIVNRNSGKVLLPTKSRAAAGAAIVQGCWTGARCQRWRIVEKANNKIALKNCAGYYLEMSSNTPANGVKLRLNEYKAAKRFMWLPVRKG